MKTSLTLIGGKRILSPKSNKTRPTTLIVREAIFNILNNKVENSNWLDLFSGSGAISCEAYNHGAKKIIAIEKDRLTAELCKKNLFSLKDSQLREKDVKIICKDVFSWVNLYIGSKLIENGKIENIKFDYIYIDPPYKNNFYKKLLKNLFISQLITDKTTVICEHSKNEEIRGDELWSIEDTRIYGQTKLSFLIKI
tara:strand:+ start:587 stop:1174 length:588 start_codon:yes stop_codon:yes gene_type:complete